MPDLSHDAALRYWFEFIDPMIYRVITFMESVENWTLDEDRSLEEALAELGRLLDNNSGVNMGTLNHEEGFLQILSQIKTSRGLRLLQAIDVTHPGSASKVLYHAQNTSRSPQDPAGFFLNRNLIFERLRLLSRVFSNERLSLVERAIEGDE